MTASRTLERLDAVFDPNDVDPGAESPRIELSEDAQRCWQRVCARISDLIADAEQYAFPSHLGVASQHPRIRVEFSGDRGELTVPYWYRGDEARDLLRLAYRIGRIVEEETVLRALDCQTGAELSGEQLSAAAEIYDRTSAVTQQIAKGALPHLPAQHEH
jgi:hypothetical protein